MRGHILKTTFKADGSSKNGLVAVEAHFEREAPVRTSSEGANEKFCFGEE